MDSNADGIGDDGYDISDNFQVAPCFGTLGDFVQFNHEAEPRGIRVIINLVVNHTSNQHPWFLDARSSRRSKYRDYYVWADKKPKDAEKRSLLFTLPGPPGAWTYFPETQSRAAFLPLHWESPLHASPSSRDLQPELSKSGGVASKKDLPT